MPSPGSAAAKKKKPMAPPATRSADVRPINIWLVVIGKGLRRRAGYCVKATLGMWRPGAPPSTSRLDPIDGTTNIAKGARIAHLHRGSA